MIIEAINPSNKVINSTHNISKEGIMKSLLRGVMIGAIASTALYNMKSNNKSMLKKGKKAIEKKIDSIF